MVQIEIPLHVIYTSCNLQFFMCLCVWESDYICYLEHLLHFKQDSNIVWFICLRLNELMIDLWGKQVYDHACGIYHWLIVCFPLLPHDTIDRHQWRHHWQSPESSYSSAPPSPPRPVRVGYFLFHSSSYGISKSSQRHHIVSNWIYL